MYGLGKTVNHKEYGKGKVIKKTGESEDAQYLIEFENENADLHDGQGYGKDKHCWWLNETEMEECVITKSTKSKKDDTTEQTMQMFKEVLDNFTKSLEEKNNDFNSVLEKNVKEIVERATENAKNAKECFMSVSELGVQLNGSVINLLAGVSSLANSLKNSGIPEDMIRSAFEKGLTNDPDEEDEEDENFKDMLKEKLEELKSKIDNL